MDTTGLHHHRGRQLTRPLLLIHGGAGDNVVVAHPLRMSAALRAAGREHQILPLSGTIRMPMSCRAPTHHPHPWSAAKRGQPQAPSHVMGLGRTS
jgi:hypothetical protein